MSINEEGEEILQSRREYGQTGMAGIMLGNLRESKESGYSEQRAEEMAGPVRRKTVTIFPAFRTVPFTFELGDEIRQVGNENEGGWRERIAGRTAIVIEVTPGGGLPYRLWVDRDTSLPLKAMRHVQRASIQASYTEIEFFDAIPDELLA